MRKRPHCGGHRALRHEVAFLQIERTRVAAALAPAQIGNRHHLRRHAFDDGDELEGLGLHLVADEPTDLGRLVGIRRVHRAQDIDVHTVPVQAVPSAHDIVE